MEPGDLLLHFGRSLVRSQRRPFPPRSYAKTARIGGTSMARFAAIELYVTHGNGGFGLIVALDCRPLPRKLSERTTFGSDRGEDGRCLGGGGSLWVWSVS